VGRGHCQGATDLRGHPQPRAGLAFAPDGKCLAVGIEAKQVLVLDLDTGKPLRPFQGAYGIRSLVFSPDGKTLMTRQRHLLRDPPRRGTGKKPFPFAAHQHYVGNLSFSPMAGRCAPVLRTRRCMSGTPRKARRCGDSLGPAARKSTAYSPDGKLGGGGELRGVHRGSTS